MERSRSAPGGNCHHHSLSVLVAWGARALLASRGNYVTRTLSFLMVFPALYAALLLLSSSPAVVRLTAADTVLETTFLLAAATAFFPCRT